MTTQEIIVIAIAVFMTIYTITVYVRRKYLKAKGLRARATLTQIYREQGRRGPGRYHATAEWQDADGVRRTAHITSHWRPLAAEEICYHKHRVILLNDKQNHFNLFMLVFVLLLVLERFGIMKDFFDWVTELF